MEQLSQNVYCGVRLGGMGVAIGSLVGQELADFSIMATKKPVKKQPSRSNSKAQNISFMGKVARFFFKLFLWGFGLSIFFVVLFKFVPVPFTPLMAIRAIENTQADKEVYLNHDWVPLEEISDESPESRYCQRRRKLSQTQWV